LMAAIVSTREVGKRGRAAAAAAVPATDIERRCPLEGRGGI
jgi:hypothetical protein